MSDLESIISNDTMLNARSDSSAKTSGEGPSPTANSLNNTTVIVKQPDEYPNLMSHILEHLTTVAHCCIFGYVAFVLFLCFKGPIVLFTWHPILLSVGWLLFMTEAVLMMRNENIFSRRIPHRLRLRWHWGLQLSAISMALSGFTIVVVNKENNNAKHFKSWHGFMGLLSIICCIPICLTGVSALFNMELRKYISPKMIKFVHAVTGIMTLTLGGVTLVLSIGTGWFGKATAGNQPIYYIAFISITYGILWTLLRPLINSFQKLKTF